MRVHASHRDDVRLWVSAAGGAIVLFSVIVLFGAGPGPFRSLLLGRAHAGPAVVLPPVAEARGDAANRAPHGTRTGHARPATHPSRSGPATGTRRRGEQPQAHPSRRPAPPVASSQKPGPASKPAATSASTPPPAAPTVPLPPPAELGSILPTLPTVDVPPLPDPTDAVPPLPAPPLP